MLRARSVLWSGWSTSSAVSASRSGRTAKYSFSPTRNRTEPSLDAVEHWLAETRIGSADVWVDERPYRIDRPRSLYQVASAQVNGADAPAKGCSSPTESAQPRSPAAPREVEA